MKKMANDGFKICEFCGCHTNAKLRRCCIAGYEADLRKSLIPKLWEEQKMSEKLHVRLRQAIKDRDKIDEEVRRLEKRIKEEEQMKIPMVRKARIFDDDRIIIRLREQAKHLFEFVDNNIIILDSCGRLCNNWSADEEKHNQSNMAEYSNVETLFEGDLE